MLKNISKPFPFFRQSLRHLSEQHPGRFNFVPRQAQSAGNDFGEEDEGDIVRRRVSVQPSSTHSSAQSIVPTNVFPEEAKQGYSIDDYPGLSIEPFSEETSRVLRAPIDSSDVEIKPDGAIFMPEVKYRRILNQAFGPGGWALIPRGPHTLNGITLSREYALFCRGRFMSQARGSTNVQGAATAASSTESVRSNALMRCCKDLGIASELWDRNFVNQWREKNSIKKTIADRFGNSKIVWVKMAH